MLRRSLVLVAAVAALALVPVATADGGGPSPGAIQGGDGVTSAAGPGGAPTRYVALPSGADTVVEAIRTSDGSVLQFDGLAGAFGIPLVTQDGGAGGLSADGKTLVVADTTPGQPLRTTSHFIVYDAKQLPAGHLDVVL